MRYDIEERLLFFAAKVTGMSVDRVYASGLFKLTRRLLARLSGSSVNRPR